MTERCGRFDGQMRNEEELEMTPEAGTPAEKGVSRRESLGSMDQSWMRSEMTSDPSMMVFGMTWGPDHVRAGSLFSRYSTKSVKLFNSMTAQNQVLGSHVPDI